MMASPPIRRIVVGVDGSEQAAGALAWAIALARSVSAEIIAVFAIPPPRHYEFGAGYAAPVMPRELDPEWRAETKRAFEQSWCGPLHDSGVRYRTVVRDGRAAPAIAEVADREDADLVVVGRRGRGGVAELVLGSVSHELTHRCSRPVVLVSHGALHREASRPSPSVALRGAL